MTDRAEIRILFHMFGQVPFDDLLALERRLAYEVGESGRNAAAVVICEHPALITIGRSGSRGDIRLTDEQLEARRLAVRRVARGGGCVLHGPGQIAIYPIVPLELLGWTVGRFMQATQSGLEQAFSELRVPVAAAPGCFGLWGRSGLLAAFGVAVRHWITQHGVFVNVHPDMTHHAFVDTAPEVAREARKATMGCLLAERRHAGRMAAARSAIVRNLAAAYGCEGYDLVTGHPSLRKRGDAHR